MTERNRIGAALDDGDVATAFRRVRGVLRFHAKAVCAVHGINPGFRAMVIGRAIDDFGREEAQRHIRHIVSLAYTAARTIDKHRKPRQGRIRVFPKPNLPRDFSPGEGPRTVPATSPQAQAA